MAGTNGEAPDFGRGLFLFCGLRRRLQPIPFHGSTEPRRGFKPSKIRDVNFIVIGALRLQGALAR